MNADDTIAAIRSAVGPAARIVIRLSGPASHLITQSLAPNWTPKPASAAHASITIANQPCPAWLYCFAAPRSYTGEDLVKSPTPGGAVGAKLLPDDLLRRGARLAEPG